MALSAEEIKDHQELKFWTLATAASILLTVAGYLGLDVHPYLTVWLTCIGVILYAFAFKVSRNNHLNYKRRITAVLIGFSILVSAGIHIWLSKKPKKVIPPFPIVASAPSGNAITSGDRSPAVTGSNVAITYGAESDTSPKKEKGR
jgi:hypothetical protein